MVIISQNVYSQNRNSSYKMEGSNPKVLTLNQTFTTSGEIYPFDKTVPKFFGLSFTGTVVFEDETSEVRLLLVDNDFNEYLVYESYPLLEQGMTVPAEDVSEETALLDGVQAYSLRIELVNASVTINQLTYTTGLGQVTNISDLKAEKKRLQDEDKISRLNRNLKERGQGWIAGPTEVSGLSYSEKKQLFGQSTFPAGFEYYSGGVITTGSTTLKSASSTSPYARVFDWRNRHGQNWITPVVNQGSCGSCWAFAATGATEALVNVFYNQLLNLNLSEQDVLSCSGAGDCNGGYPSTALAYITGTGVVDEGAFPYSGTKEACTNKSSTPSERIKIGGRVDFGSTLYPRTEDDLKRMLIEMGPLSGGLYDWSHAMVMVGYQVVQEGDVFYYRDLNLSRYWKTVSAGDPLIGKTVWIFKNSWSDRFGDKGYVYVETPITNIGWTHGLKTPVMSLVKSYNVVCEDRDGDGYYWWGLGPKPAGCDCPAMPDGDDSDPTLGPLDAYGNCTPLNASPVADFKANATSVTSGQSVSLPIYRSTNR
jgi:C1A family cysteine protease